MTDKVLVTGGAGYVGAHACKALAKAGFTPVDLPPGRPSLITRVRGVDSGRFRVGQALRARSHQVAQARDVHCTYNSPQPLSGASQVWGWELKCFAFTLNLGIPRCLGL
jgi:nucleoside-diphosphate-sugar epimerase